MSSRQEEIKLFLEQKYDEAMREKNYDDARQIEQALKGMTNCPFRELPDKYDDMERFEKRQGINYDDLLDLELKLNLKGDDIKRNYF